MYSVYSIAVEGMVSIFCVFYCRAGGVCSGNQERAFYCLCQVNFPHNLSFSFFSSGTLKGKSSLLITIPHLSTLGFQR